MLEILYYIEIVIVLVGLYRVYMLAKNNTTSCHVCNFNHIILYPFYIFLIKKIYDSSTS